MLPNLHTSLYATNNTSVLICLCSRIISRFQANPHWMVYDASHSAICVSQLLNQGQPERMLYKYPEQIEPFLLSQVRHCCVKFPGPWSEHQINMIAMNKTWRCILSTSCICSFQKDTHSTNCFEVTFYKVCHSDWHGCWCERCGLKPRM